MDNTTVTKINWKVVSITSMVIIAILLVSLFVVTNNTNTDGSPETSPSQISDSVQDTASEGTVSSVDDLMADFQGTDDEVIQVCATELKALGIDYVSIDEPLEGVFIQETRVGTYELNGILRTTRNSPDMLQPKSTEMLCTIFPGDEYPVEITFGKDW